MSRATLAPFALCAALVLFVLPFAGAAFADSYAVKDGQLTRIGSDGSEKPGESEAHEIEGLNPGAAVRFWALIGEDEKPADGKGTGVRFFGADGRALAFLPLESVYEFQNAIFSPDGGRLIAAIGSGVRNDVEFIVRDFPSMKERVSFGGLKWQIEWLDARRLVFTRIGDDIREGGFSPGLGYGLALSAVVYDAVSGETIVLKEATATRNYMFSLVNTETNVIQLTEQFVESERDWGDEEKIGEREITVPIPDGGE
jgi:hypothetical protein